MKYFDEMGLCISSRKKLAYTVGGCGSNWLPRCVQKFIVKIWNYVACKIWGHFWFPDFDQKNGGVWKKNKKGVLQPVGYTYEVCCDCCKRRKRNDALYL